MKSILEPSLPLRVLGSMRSTHNAFQWVIMTSFGGTWPYFWLCLLFIWQDLQDLTYFWMVLCIPFQYMTDLIVSLRRKCPGCWRWWWYQLTALCHRDAEMSSLSFLHNSLNLGQKHWPSKQGVSTGFISWAINKSRPDGTTDERTDTPYCTIFGQTRPNKS